MEALYSSKRCSPKAQYLCPFEVGKFIVTSWIGEDGNDVTMTPEYLSVNVTSRAIKVQIPSESTEFDIGVGQRIEIRDGRLITSLLD